MSPPFYCSLCETDFPDQDSCAGHTSQSTSWCEGCGLRFENEIALREHWVNSNDEEPSKQHYYCLECMVDFLGIEGLQMHLQLAARHREKSSEDEDFDTPNLDWDSDFAADIFPEEEFEAARLRGELQSYNPEEDEGYDTDDDYFENDESTLTYHPQQHQPVAGNRSADESSVLSNSECDSRSRPFTCPLCLEIPQHCISTQCGHIFCEPCLERSLKLKNCCPVCASLIESKSLRRMSLSEMAQSMRRSFESISKSVRLFSPF